VTRRQSYQQGYVSKPIPTRSGTVFKIRYRVKSADGKWNQKAETLYGLSGKKAARCLVEALLAAQRCEAIHEKEL
jgi:hypothetical protein